MSRDWLVLTMTMTKPWVRQATIGQESCQVTPDMTVLLLATKPIKTSSTRESIKKYRSTSLHDREKDIVTYVDIRKLYFQVQQKRFNHWLFLVLLRGRDIFIYLRSGSWHWRMFIIIPMTCLSDQCPISGPVKCPPSEKSIFGLFYSLKKLQFV